MYYSKVWYSGKLTLIIILIIITTGCVNTTSSTYIVGVNGDYPPYSYYNSNRELVGFDIELINEIANTENMEIQIKQVEWLNTIPSLVNGDIDIYISHLVITPERESIISFSNPYKTVGQAIAVNNGTNFTYEQFLSGDMTIAVQGSTINAEWINKTLGNELYTTMINEERIQFYDTFPQSMMAVTLGLADCAVFDDGDVRYYVKNVEEEPGRDLKILTVVDTHEQYGIATRNNDTELLEKINTGLEKIMNSENWTRLSEKYLIED